MGEIKYEIKKLPLGELFTFKPKAEPLETYVIDKIKALIMTEVKDRKEELIKDSNDDYKRLWTHIWTMSDKLVRGVDWRHMNEKGSLTKRIKTHLYKTFKIKISTQTLGKIGMLIADNIVATKEYALDTTGKFDWEAGDFGDGGSCFFGGRSGIRMDMMSDGGFKSVRFFTKDFLGRRQGNSKYHKDYAGIGRAWIWTTKVKTKDRNGVVIESDTYVVFNGYGPNTHWQASFLAAYLKLPMKRITLTNQEDASGGLYVNSGAGYIIGDEAIISSVTSLDFGLKEHFCKKAGFN